MSNFYTYAFVRRDLPESQRIIQVAHAVHGAAFVLGRLTPEQPPNIVLFEVDDEEDLILVYRELHGSVPLYMFEEPDYDRGFTALASAPLERDDARRAFFVGYRLYDAASSPVVPAEAAE